MTYERPLLSVVVSIPDTFETVRALVGHLRAQSLSGRVELVLVCPDPATVAVPTEQLEGFAAVQVVAGDPMRSLAAARAAGARTATADVVAFLEDHAFPAAGWAEALVDAHGDGVGGVGAVMVNLNPRTPVSWTDLFLSYGAFVEGARSGVIERIPSDNSSYRRAALLELDPDLEVLLDDEAALQHELRARGYELHLDVRARLLHLNFSRLRSWLRLRYAGGRAYAGERARRDGWSRARRLAWAGLALPGVLGEIAPFLRDVRGNELHSKRLVRLLPTLALGLLAGAAGKLVGYAVGSGDAPRTVTAFSFHRPAHMRADERSLAAPPGE